MTTLVVGASGATGKHLVDHLTKEGKKVKVIVRPNAHIPDNWKKNNQIRIIELEIANTTIDEMAKHLSDCSAIASCLGHNISMKGIYGKPKRLVADSIHLLCQAASLNSNGKPMKIVLMSATGVMNRDLKEPRTLAERALIFLLRVLLPPHVDNEKASEYLRIKIGQNHPVIDWVMVRPDNLVNEEAVSEYELHPSPTRSGLFNPGKTSRINVGHFMASLISNDDLWNEWKGKMPVIYNVIAE